MVSSICAVHEWASQEPAEVPQFQYIPLDSVPCATEPCPSAWCLIGRTSCELPVVCQCVAASVRRCKIHDSCRWNLWFFSFFSVGTPATQSGRERQHSIPPRPEHARPGTAVERGFPWVGIGHRCAAV